MSGEKDSCIDVRAMTLGKEIKKARLQRGIALRILYIP